MNVKQLQTYKIYMNYRFIFRSYSHLEKKHLINVKSNIY